MFPMKAVQNKPDNESTNVILRCFRVTIVAVEKQ